MVMEEETALSAPGLKGGDRVEEEVEVLIMAF